METPRRVGSPPLVAAATALLLTTSAGWADVVRVDATGQGDRGRVVLTWPAPVGASSETRDGRLFIRFDRPIEGDFWAIRKLRRFTRLPVVGEGGRSLIFTLRPRIVAIASVPGDKVLIDFSLAPPQPDVTSSPRTETSPTELAAEAPPAHTPPPPQGSEPPPSPDPTAANPAPSSPPAGESAAAPVQATANVPSPANAGAALRFLWDRPVAAAVFQRGHTLWCIFDVPSTQDTAALVAQAGGRARAIEQQPHDAATVLRISAEAGLAPRLERDGLTWIIRLSPDASATAPGEPVAPTPDLSGMPRSLTRASRLPLPTGEGWGEGAQAGSSGPRLLLPVPEPGLPIAITDPEFGDTIIVVPVIPLAGRVAVTYTYPQFSLPASLQGIVVQPLIDTLRVRSLHDGVELSSGDGLVLSPAASTGSSGIGRQAATTEEDRLLDARDWTERSRASFTARRQALERAVIASAGAERERNRLRLAQFLLSQRFATEALGVLTLAAEQRPVIVGEPKFLLLRGAARLLAGRGPEARDDLSRAAASGVDEAELWSAAVRASAGEPAHELPHLARWTAIAADYPAALRGPLTLWLAEAAVAGGSSEAEQLIEAARAEAKSAEDRSQIALLEGLRQQNSGNIEAALADFERAARMDPRRGRARAELERTLLLRKQDRLSPEQAIAALEALRFAWRGDQIEYRLLRELGRLYLQVGDYPTGLRTLKVAASDFPGIPGAAETTGEMSRAFEQLFLEGRADQLPPLTALALYEEFKELTPVGDKGSEMLRRLADRLVRADLLEQAASLLDGLLPHVAPSEKARLGAQLSEIRLRDGKPEAALADLQRTTAPGLPAELQQHRTLAQARALMALGRGDAALAALGRDSSVDAELLRAKVHRDRGDWEQTAASLRRVIERAREGATTPLGEQQARDVLDLAVALTLGGSDSQLAELEREYGPAMAATPLKDAFRLLAGGTARAGADAAALADQVERAMAFRRSLAQPAATPSARR